MKLNSLPFLMFGLSLALPLSAYEVPTTQQYKNILLEEFTGIHCGFCPQGHAIANNLLVAQPNCSYSMAVHGGYYATPAPGEPDFRTDDGNIINSQIGAEAAGSGYPSGMVNRHNFSGSSPVSGRSNWIKDAKTINQDIAPVNLLIKSNFDGSTRMLRVTVEGYYTRDVEQPFNLLNIALTQSNIKGYQNGSGVGEDYIHNHVLRDYITPAWGDTIKAPKQGDYFSRDYTYTLPADINGIELKAENIDLIAFVCVDKTEILNVTGGKPSYTNYDKPLSATLLASEQALPKRYGANFFDSKLKNLSSQPVTSAEFEVTINGSKQNVTWTGTIRAFETVPVEIHVSPYEVLAQNQYEILLTKLNGQNITGNSLKGDFAAPTECTSKIFIEIQTDLYADENIFTIKDREGNVVKEFGPYPTETKAVYKESVELEASAIYYFEIADLWGDGMQQPRGYYKLSNEDKSLISQVYDIPLYGNRFFFHTSLTSGISELGLNTGTKVVSDFSQNQIELSFTPASSGKASIGIYSVSGKQLLQRTIPVESGIVSKQTISTAQLPQGIYFVHIRQGENNEVIKVIIR